MTIDEAIRTLTERTESPFVRANPHTNEATKLGIEALKVVKWQRIPGAGIRENRLPGETPAQTEASHET